VTYVIFCDNSQLPQHDEARAVLERFGEIAKIERLEERIQKLMGVPESLLVHFRKFDPRRDVIKVCPTIDNTSSI
jgi:tetrahydromethanopterin S-methyltransferase subunit B